MMSHKSVGDFEEKFAEIDINIPKLSSSASFSLPPPVPSPLSKKKYPTNLYPSSKALPRTPTGKLTGDGSRNTTPSISPVLSTARRAESRSLKQQSPDLGKGCRHPSGPNLDFGSSRISLLAKPPPSTAKRHISGPPVEDSVKVLPQPQFSFMRETSSSTLKKQATPSHISIKQSPSSISSPSKYRSVSESHKLTPNHKKRPLRTVSNSVPQTTHTASRARLVSNSKAAALSKSKPSDITNMTYDNPSGDTANQTLEKPKKEHPYKALTVRNTTRSTSVEPQIPSRSRSSSDAKRRFESLEALCNDIYKEQPGIFEDAESSDAVFTSNTPVSPQDLNSEVTTGETPLSIYERGEILRKKDIYYIPNRLQSNQQQQQINIRNYNDNYGFDDENGNYLVKSNDHINYRFEIEKLLGNGSFGNVVECSDHKYWSQTENRNKMVAIKIIKNDLNWSLQAVYEIKMLKHLNDKFKNGVTSNTNGDAQYNEDYGNDNSGCPILTYFDHFHFRGHMCIVTEVLSLNLYSLLEITKFKGVSGSLLKDFSTKILEGLEFIHDNKIIHCDIKPENIMIKLPTGFKPDTPLDDNDFIVKIIDFGSSCFNDEISYSYIQSRFYRAPEVITGAKYNKMIDIWSFGCVIAEMYSGFPLFPGKNELEQIGLIAEVIGAPSSSLVLSQRNMLMKSIRSQNAARNMFDGDFMAPKINTPMSKKSTIDEKSTKKTLLYTLFDLEGKINLDFLNHRLQIASSSHAPTTSNFNSAPLRKNIRLSSKSLEVAVKISNFGDEDKKQNQLFIKFLQLIFKWDPSERLAASDLLQHRFLHQN